jgi:hypothetical protein
MPHLPSWLARFGQAFHPPPSAGHAPQSGAPDPSAAGPSQFGYTCHSCGTYHAELPLGYGAPEPDSWHSIPEQERDSRCALTDSTCVIDDELFLLRGNVEIPIHGQDTCFWWGVWVSLSRTEFERIVRLWDDPSRANEPPYFGKLATRLPGYPETLNLHVNLHTAEAGTRPYVELEPTDHPLAVEQRSGVTMARVQQIAESYLHGWG